MKWYGDGFRLHFKRPSNVEEAVMSLNAEELKILLGEAWLELKLRRNEVKQRRTT